MGFLDKKLRQLEEGEVGENIVAVASDKTSELIRALSGRGTSTGKKLVDNLVLVTNASGGTGTSTIISNVAYCATKKGIKTCVVDLNILCPMQPILFGVDRENAKNDLTSFLLGKSELNESIDISKPVNLMYANDRLLLDKLYCNEKTSIENLNIMFNKLRQFYDLVLIDCPMNIDSMVENVALYSCDTMYVVWDESLASMLNTERLRRSLALSGIDSFIKMKVILNKRTSVHYSKYPTEKMNLELVETLPFDIDIIDSQLKGQIFCEKGVSNKPNALEFARRIDILTDKILKNGGYVE